MRSANVSGADTAAADHAVAANMLQALALTEAAICLCDENDLIRFANAIFRTFFIPDFDGEGDFAEAICAAAGSGKGLKLGLIDLDAFKKRVRQRRKDAVLEPFSIELADGSWWRAQEYRTAGGWLLTIATNVSALKDEERRLREAHASALQASQTDYLTEVANRRWGMELAQRTLDDCALQRAPVTIALLDIDHFKSINDRHGHDVGDAVLTHFAAALSQRLGLHDQVSRIGGEEFMVVMPDTAVAAAQKRLERLLRTLPPLRRAGEFEPLVFTFSAGIATASPGDSLKRTLGHADSALYRAKSEGRSRVELAAAAASNAA